MWPITAAARVPYLPLIGQVRGPCPTRLNVEAIHSFRGVLLLLDYLTILIRTSSDVCTSEDACVMYIRTSCIELDRSRLRLSQVAANLLPYGDRACLCTNNT
jgi:hypothetical protein